MNLSTHKKSEVDLRVAQELKNNQDFIYQTNQALQNLSQSVIALSLQNEKLRAQFDNDKKAMEISQENFMKDMNNRSAMLTQRVSAAEDGVVRMLSEVQGRLDAFRTQMVSPEILDEKFKKISDWMEISQKSFDRLLDYSVNAISGINGKLASEVVQLRKDLTQDPNAINPIKSEVEDLLKSMRVDFQGLITELALVKRDVAYGKKKFENIYTLIDRLKARTP